MAQLPFTFRKSAPPPEAPGVNSDAPSTAPEPEIFTVRALQRAVRQRLEQSFPDVWVTGELSNLKRPDSGHAYFSLKDRHAQVDCVMWRDDVLHLRFAPRDGLEVLVRAQVTVFEKGGRLQLAVKSLEPVGLGALHEERRQTAEKLRAEGLLASEKKRPLPAFPSTIGVVTSRHGAAVRDVIRTILRRDPRAHIVISSCAVQGRAAAAGIVQAIRRLDRLGICDVIIVARGGGSIEDLWAFNTEPVARAIAETSVPVITGLGHESDTTVADLVADLRASTPTAAAETAVPVRAELELRVQELEAALGRRMRSRLAHAKSALLTAERRLDPHEAAFRRRAQELDELKARAERALRRRLARDHQQLRALSERLAGLSPRARLGNWRRRLERLDARREDALRRRREATERRFAVAVGRLESLSPLGVLSRGYAVVRTVDGHVVQSASDVEVGTELDLRVARGRIGARVVGTSEDE